MKVFSSHPRAARTLCVGHDFMYWGAAEQDDSNIWLVMFLERAVGGFPPHGKSKHFAFPAHYSWANRFRFSQYILLIIEREVFQRIQRWTGFFDTVFHFRRRNGLCRLTSFLCVTTTWKNYFSIKKEDWYKREKNQFKILFIPPIC